MVERGSLENCCAGFPYRGFESLPLRLSTKMPIGLNGPMGSKKLMRVAAGSFSIGAALSLLVDEGWALLGIGAVFLATAAGLFGLALHKRETEAGGMPSDLASWGFFMFGIDPPKDRLDEYQGLIFVRNIQIWNLLVLGPIAVAVCIAFPTTLMILLVAGFEVLALVNLAWIQIRIARLQD